MQHAATFSLLELPDAKSLLRLAGISDDAEEIDANAVVQALERHKFFLKQMRMDALVKAESEVAQIGGVLPADAAEEASRGGAAVDAAQLQAAVEGAMSRLEQRMQAFIQEEMRKAIVIIAKLDVPREAPPPPQFTAQQFRCVLASAYSRSRSFRVHAYTDIASHLTFVPCFPFAPAGARAINDAGGGGS